MYYRKDTLGKVQCLLCPHACTIDENSYGKCGVRKNIDGTLYSKNYGYVSSIAIDPIEKKPLRMYKRHSKILSVGTMGCNFSCPFCQNYHISQLEPPLHELGAAKLLGMSDDMEESIGIAFTYNEPIVWYEYVYDVAKKNKKDNVLVSNGYINREPFLKLLPHIDAINIDIKSFSSSFYREHCDADVEFVKNSIILAHENTHMELTFLAIPGVNDADDEIIKLSQWIAEMDKNIPLHIIPFRPMYKMLDVPFQSSERLSELKTLALETLINVF